MKILVVHNSYQQRGGEDAAAHEEVELLRSAGHDVVFHQVSNDTISGLLSKLKTLARTPYNRASGTWMTESVRDEAPDVVHIHNAFPLLSPAIHEAAARSGVAVVQTLHNYRTICAGATLLRAGRHCQKCVSGNRLWGALHQCYRQSLPASLAVVAMQLRADRTRTWHRHVHRFIAPSEHSKALFAQGGLPADRIVVKPNFTVEPAVRDAETPRHGALFVGRLSPEKGVSHLIHAWRQMPDMALTIVGDGPLRESLMAAAAPSVTFTGELSRDGVRDYMRSAQLLIVPSTWPEPFGLVVVEAFAHGLPVLAANAGALSALVRPGHNGALVNPGDAADLKAAMQRLLADPNSLMAMGRNARIDYEKYYTPSRNLELLETIYREAIAVARHPSLTLP